LRDDGKIIAAQGKRDDVVLLLGYSYFNGWIAGGWYYTGEVTVVKAVLDENGIDTEVNYQ